MAQMAGYADGSSPRASRTKHTARSRTSDFSFVSLMTPDLSTAGVSGQTEAV
jgi:hypothetical protein